MQTQVPGQLCGAEKFIPPKKEKEENPFKLPHCFKAESRCVWFSWPCPICRGKPGTWVTALGCGVPAPPAPSGLGSLFPRRCGRCVWAAVPLHPLQVLPGIHRGCAGTVSTWPGGFGYPKPVQGGWGQDAVPGVGFLPTGGTEGSFASPPSPPTSSWPCHLFPGSVSEEGGGQRAPARAPRAPGRLVVSDGVFSPRRLGPLYASAWLLWALLGLAVAGLLAHFLLSPSSAWMAALARPLQLLGVW